MLAMAHHATAGRAPGVPEEQLVANADAGHRLDLLLAGLAAGLLWLALLLHHRE